MKPIRRKVRGVRAAQSASSTPIQIVITAPGDGLSVASGTPIQFAGQAAKQVPTDPSQAGTVIHSLPGSGWTEVAPGQWRSDAGDIEQETFYHVTDEEWWGLNTGTTSDTFCELYSVKTGQVLPADQDFWVCPQGAFLPSQPGFHAPDLSELIEWFDGSSKIGEGASIMATLDPGDHVVTALVQSGQDTGRSTVQVSVQSPAAQPAQGGTSTTPTPAPTQTTTVPITPNTPGSLVAQGSGSSWLWLLILLAIVLSQEEK